VTVHREHKVKRGNQQDATNSMFIIKLLFQHVSGIILPIIRRIRPCPTVCGVLPECVGCGFFNLLLLFSNRFLPSSYTTGYLQFYNEFYSDVCGVHEEYRQIYFPWASSWSAWKIRLRKFVMLTVFMRNCRTKDGGRDLRTVGRSFDHKLHSGNRWRAVCTVLAGQLHYGEVILFILYRYEWKLPRFVKNWVRRKLFCRVKESLWKMVGMYSIVWEAFLDFTYILFQTFM